MTNFHIDFSCAWLLLLLIPAFALTLIPHFRVAKRYRRNRNRIVSLVLHLMIMVMCITVLSGMTFGYEIPNLNNEVILLVDASYSNRESTSAKDDFIRESIQASAGDIKLGIVTFGYNQVLAAEMSYDTDAIYEQYMTAEQPDTSATDIASALTYAHSLFTHPETSKIVLLTDGVETDGEALSVIRAISATGTKVDTMSFPNTYGDEALISGVQTPDYNIRTGDTFNLAVALKTTFKGSGKITLNDVLCEKDFDGNMIRTPQATSETPIEFALSGDEQTFNISHSFAKPGLHELSFTLECSGDTLVENNVFHTYINLLTFDKILLIEKYSGESNELKKVLDDADFDVSVANVADTEKMPDTLDELRAYDQVVLVNIANADMPEGFTTILNQYVSEIGGGLLTVGGNKLDDSGEPLTDHNGNFIPNAYNREDMNTESAKIFKDMLPVEAINYTPPVGVMFVIDCSGSMTASDPTTGKSFLDLAKEAAISCLSNAEIMSDRDWAGVVSLESEASAETNLLPLTRVREIIASIDSLESNGGTVFTGAIRRAGTMLAANSSVEKKEIIIITDGAPGDAYEDYSSEALHFYESFGIRTSVIAIKPGAEASELMKQFVSEAGHGEYCDVTDPTTIQQEMREIFTSAAIEEIKYEEFVPTIRDHTSAVSGIAQADMPKLKGYYGTRVKNGADVPLMGKYVPVYASWKYGNGMVGSFMCDLSGVWSDEFIASATGIRFINNVINSLFPTADIRPSTLDAEILSGNYTNQAIVYSSLAEGERIQVRVISAPEEGSAAPVVQVIAPTAEQGYGRIPFSITRAGIHEIVVEKLDASDTVIATYSTYKAFSYSAEYNTFVDEAVALELINDLAKFGKGEVVTGSSQVFDDFQRTISKTYDPCILFIILSIILFLLDVAVRKFKFKWPHEIIRDYKLKKEMNNTQE